MSRPPLCSLCRRPGLRPYFELRNARYWRCPNCGLIQMHPLLVPEGAAEDYAGYDLERYGEFLRAFRVPQYLRDAALIRKYSPGGNLLDVGCGTGEFLDVAERNGFSAFGLEPSKNAYEIARRTHPVVRGELRDISFRDGGFDAVTAWSVLEHVPDPLDFLGRIRALLKRGGVLAVRVPDARGLLPFLALFLYRISFGLFASPLAILYQLDWNYKHLYGHDRKTLRRLMESSGLEVLTCLRENSFNRRSMDLRMCYLPVKPVSRKPIIAALGVVGFLAKLIGREDEIVLIARKI